jgi:hypothetical protein
VTTAENQSWLRAGIIYADTKGMLDRPDRGASPANVYEKRATPHLGLPNILKPQRPAESETPFLVVRIMHDGQTCFRERPLPTPIASRQRSEIRQASRGVRFVARRYADGCSVLQ